MAKINLTTQVNAYQSAGYTASANTDSVQTDFLEMIQGSTQTVSDKKDSSDSSKEEKIDTSSKDSKKSEKAEEKVKEESKETEVQPKGELSAEWMLQMQAMDLQVVPSDANAELLENVTDVVIEVQASVMDAETQISMSDVQQIPESVEANLSEIGETVLPEMAEMVVPEAVEMLNEQDTSSENVEFSVETLSELSSSLEEVQTEAEVVEANPQLQSDSNTDSNTDSNSDFDDLQDALVEQSSSLESTKASDSKDKEENDTKVSEDFQGELSLQQMQGQNLRMQNSFTEKTQEAPATMQTTQATLPEDLGNTLAQRFPAQDGTLTIELNPEHLGKLTIQVVYEEGNTEVSIFASNPKTLELLSENAGEIAQILEDKTGQEVAIYTPETEQNWEEQSQKQEQQNPREQEPQERKKQSEPDSFAQQLRLGLVQF